MEGTVTFLLTDVEGSARAWDADPEAMRQTLARHDEIVAAAVADHGGHLVKTKGEGDSTFSVFRSATAAVRAALALQRALAGTGLAVRAAIHAGDAEFREGDWFGAVPTRCARLRELAHGGQILVSLPVAALVAGAGFDLRDLGSHRLRDLRDAEHVYQVCDPDAPREFPPLRSAGRPAGNLPAEHTSFIGRTQELRAVGELLARARLVTLTGAGGCGKTRLAIRAARDGQDGYPDGAWLADLSALTEPEAVARAVAHVLGLGDVVGADPVSRVTAHLGPKRALVVLDNCEHLIEAGARLASAIVDGCPDVTVVATSREPLGVAGESVLRVPPLAVPGRDTPLDAMRSVESVRLFCERASALRHNFELDDGNAAAVAEICRRLDGIPLALELAAGRVNVLTPAQIAAALDDRFRLLAGSGTISRQRTLEASVEWSYSLLDDAERAVLCRASVFAGGFVLPEADVVCAADGVAPDDVLGVVARLVDRSLVVAEETDGVFRYRLLESVRLLAAARLVERGEADDARRAHRDAYLALCERTAPALESRSDGQAAFLRLVPERANVRAAYEYSLANGEAEQALRLVSATWVLWMLTASATEGIELFERALAAAPDAPLQLRAAGRMGFAQMLIMAGENERARPEAEEAVALARSAGDRRLLAWSLGHLGWTVMFSDPDAAASILTESIRDSEGLPVAITDATATLGFIESLYGDPARARELHRRALDVAGDAFGLWSARSHDVLRRVIHLDGLDEIPALIAELRATSFGSLIPETIAVSMEAWTAQLRGELDEAERLWRRALALADESGFAYSTVLGTLHLGRLQVWQGRPRDALATLEHSPVIAAGVGPPFVAWSLTALASAHRALGEAVTARRLLGEAVATARTARIRYEQAEALIELARLELDDGDADAAAARLREALATAAVIEHRGTASPALEVLAEVLARSSQFEEAVRLVAAAAADRANAGYEPSPPERASVQRAAAAARDALGEEAFGEAWSHGSATPLWDAVASVTKGRGPRGRPSSGWDSLTPAELAVVRRAAGGASNKDIAAALYLSPRTVQNHLSHVYAKLGISTRAELAAIATRQLGG